MCDYRTREPRERGLEGYGGSEKIAGQYRIGKLEEARELVSFPPAAGCEVPARKALEQDIQLLHPATAAP